MKKFLSMFLVLVLSSLLVTQIAVANDEDHEKDQSENGSMPKISKELEAAIKEGCGSGGCMAIFGIWGSVVMGNRNDATPTTVPFSMIFASLDSEQQSKIFDAAKDATSLMTDPDAAEVIEKNGVCYTFYKDKTPTLSLRIKEKNNFEIIEGAADWNNPLTLEMPLDKLKKRMGIIMEAKKAFPHIFSMMR